MTEPIAPVTESSPNSHHTHEEFQALADKLNEVNSAFGSRIAKVEASQEQQARESSQKFAELESATQRSIAELSSANARSKSDADEKFAERLGALERSVAEVVNTNRLQATEMSQALDALKATVKKAPDAGQLLSEYSSKADQRMIAVEREVQNLKDVENQLKKLGGRLEALEKIAKTQDETLVRLTKISGNNNVTDLALFVDRVVKGACTFYEQTVVQLAHRSWAYARNFSAIVSKHSHEFIEYVVDFKTPGSTLPRQAHAVLKQKLTAFGVPAEHGDLAAFASIMAAIGMAALLSLLLLCGSLLLPLRHQICDSKCTARKKE